MSSPQLAPLAGGQVTPPEPSTNNRVVRSFALRAQTAARDALIPAPPQIDNGDEARYSDKSGTYTKAVRQAAIGLVDPVAYETFKKALNSGEPADFEAIILGGTRTLNDPQGGLAFDLDCVDSSQFAAPPAPALASEDYATELVELYWASLLRDVAFTDYPANPVAIEAAKNCRDWQVTKDQEMLATKLHRSCCSEAVWPTAPSPARRSDPISHSSSSKARPWVLCRSIRNT